MANGATTFAVTLVNKPNKDLLALDRDMNLPKTATWDAEFARMLTQTPDWPA